MKTDWIEKSELVLLICDCEELPKIDENIRLIQSGKVKEGLDNLVRQKTFEVKYENGKEYYRINPELTSLVLGYVVMEDDDPC